MRQKHQLKVYQLKRIQSQIDSIQKSTKPSKEKKINTPQIVLQNRHWRNVSKFFVWSKYYHKKTRQRASQKEKKLQASISGEYRKGSG